MAGSTVATPLRTRETDACDTPAYWATCVIVMGRDVTSVNATSSELLLTLWARLNMVGRISAATGGSSARDRTPHHFDPAPSSLWMSGRAPLGCGPLIG